ncbi:MAG TPA: hypothetical protein VGL63_04915 [Streptosporangiaceae bacterium]|jgi:hypothetical protein
MTERSGSSGDGGSSGSGGSSGGGGSSGSDPIGDLQRWLMRRSARGFGNQLRDQARRTIGGGSKRAGDVWEVATAEPLPGEAPECAWCPVCRAARKFRDSGPGLASHVAGAGDALFSVAQDTLAAFEATLAARPPGSRQESRPAPDATRPGPGRPDASWSDATRPDPSGPGVGWPDASLPEPGSPARSWPDDDQPAPSSPAAGSPVVSQAEPRSAENGPKTSGTSSDQAPAPDGPDDRD